MKVMKLVNLGVSLSVALGSTGVAAMAAEEETTDASVKVVESVNTGFKEIDQNYWFIHSSVGVPPVVPPYSVYIVQDGDNLSKIAADYGTTWQALAEYNNLEDPDVLAIGDEIRIPA